MSAKILNLDGNTHPVEWIKMLEEHGNEVAKIAAVIEWKDGSTSVHHTVMSHQEMCWMRWCFDQDFRPEEK